MKSDAVWIIGGGGLARGVKDALQSCHVTIGGLVLPRGQAADWFDGRILAEDDFLKLPGETSALVAVGDNARRKAIVRHHAETRPGIRWVSACHADASVSPTAEIGEGAIILPGAMVGPAARIGQHVLVYSGCIIEHDCQVEAFASFGPGATLGGNVSIGEATFIGLGANVGHGRSIGADTVIGLGAAVVSDIGSNVVAYGIPCKVVSTRTHGDRYL